MLLLGFHSTLFHLYSYNDEVKKKKFGSVVLETHKK
jgi:hypothetical protein